MSDPIQIVIGVTDENYSGPLSFFMYEDGASFDPEYTRGDFIKSIAILRDLADMLEHKLISMNH